jgi:pseudaminic acid cytidylyltransferase
MSDHEKRVALIPARGGSKRVPRKNILPFRGVPMIEHTIKSALESHLFDEVYVSTEDEEIDRISTNLGVKVIDRDNGLASDDATVTEVTLDFLDRVEGQGRHYGVLCVLYATSPLRDKDDIISVVSLLEKHTCHFAMAVTSYSLPVHQAHFMRASQFIDPIFPELLHKRESEIENIVVDNGSTYAVHVDSFKQQKTFYGAQLKGYEMPRMCSIDIDTPDDYEMLLSLESARSF